MKSKKMALALSFVGLLNFTSCTDGGSKSKSKKSKKINLEFNSLEGVNITLNSDAKKNLEAELLASVDNTQLLADINELKLEIANTQTELAEKKLEKSKIQGELSELTADIETKTKKQESLLLELQNTDTSSSKEVISAQQELEALREKKKTAKQAVQKAQKEYDQAMESLIASQKALNDLGFIDGIFEMISDVRTDQIETQKAKIKELEKALANKKMEYKLQEQLKEAKDADFKTKLQADYKARASDIETKNSTVLSIAAEVEDLIRKEGSLAKTDIDMAQDLSELEVELTSKQEKLKALEKAKEESVYMDILRENGSAAASKLKVINELAEGKLSIQNISKALIAVHNESYESPQRNNNEMVSLISDLAKNSSVAAITDLKLTYEDLIASGHGGQELQYNSNFYRLTDPSLNNRIQCYSGTLLFNVINELSDKTFENTVVIFTKGHVLPGFIEHNDGKLYLKGIETTAGGRAIVNYGETSQIGGRIRVFDAKQFLLAELLRHEIANVKDIYGQMLKTVEKYGFKTDGFEAFDNGRATKSKQFNMTVFGFGSSNENGRDKSREPFDEKEEMEFVPVPQDDKQDFPDQREKEFYGELTPCKQLKLIVGDVDFFNGETQCLNDSNNVIWLSSYQAKPLFNSASVSKNGAPASILIDEDSNNGTCIIRPADNDNKSFRIFMSENEEFSIPVIDAISFQLFKAGAPESKAKGYGITSGIRLDMYEPEVVNTIINGGSKSIDGNLFDLEVISQNYFRYVPPGGTKCTITSKKQALNRIMSQGTFMHDIPKGRQITISCPEMRSEADSIKNVEIKVNCAFTRYNR